MDEPVAARILRNVISNLVLLNVALAVLKVVVMWLDIVNHEQVQRLQVQVHDALRVDLVQAEQKISSNDLDVAEVQSLAPVDEVLEEVGRPWWQLELLDSLNFLQHFVFFVLWPFGLDLRHERAADETGGLLRDKEEHVL